MSVVIAPADAPRTLNHLDPLQAPLNEPYKNLTHASPTGYCHFARAIFAPDPSLGCLRPEKNGGMGESTGTGCTGRPVRQEEMTSGKLKRRGTSLRGNRVAGHPRAATVPREDDVLTTGTGQKATNADDETP